MARISKKLAGYPLRVARVRQGLSIRELADLVGIGERTMARIERGESIPSHKTARALFDFFDAEVPIVSIYDPAWYLEQE